MTRLAMAVLGLLVAACGNDGPMESENYGNILNSPAGLVLVEEEHPTGYGRPDCFVCHESRNFHVVNRTGLPDCGETVTESCIDLADIRQLVRTEGVSSCALCHGDNGVMP